MQRRRRGRKLTVFSEHKEEGKALTNAWMEWVTVNIDGQQRAFPCGESALCAAFFSMAAGSYNEFARLFSTVFDAKHARQLWRKHAPNLSTEEDRRRWYADVGCSVQEEICRYKYKYGEPSAQHVVKDFLQATGDRRLIYDTGRRNDKAAQFWGCRVNKQTGKHEGDNHLGQIWEKIRREQLLDDVAAEYKQH